MMNKDEILKKINNVKKKNKGHERFVQPRPPEEFGDAVELSFNKEEHTFHAIVFDPDTDEVFSKKDLSNVDETYAFITKVLEPKLEEQNKQKDYIDLDLGEPER
ncbi:hypothetical protein ACFFHM_15515 [Halalkalibacter kiskunsagensis]|uniref:Uncharacterized protein n=1 Tax=Halalkalibacter kiskunsagensis TaxID=1548599 RepID=A0ABV6KEV9_9BACI